MPAPTFEQRSALMRQLWDRMDFDPGQKPACMAKARKVLAGKAQYLKVQSATVSRSTKTYTAAGLRLKIGVL